MTKSTCSFDGCTKPCRTLGLCDSHYWQHRQGKDLKPLGGQHLSLEERFWQKVDKSGSCWVWTGATFPDGYGCVRLNGTNAGAHRLSYEWAKGEIPEGLFIDHICHNTSCVNPDHLRLATNKQNRENVLGAQSTSRSGIRGAIWNSSKQKWGARVGHNGKRYYAGYFDTPEEAGEAARLKRLELFTHNNLDR